MTFLLDTNSCIVYISGRSDTLRQRMDNVGDGDIVVCSIVKAELCFGATKSASPEKSFAVQRKFVDRFVSIPFDDRAALVYGRIRAELERRGTPIGGNDLMIAAIAVANDLTLVTHNVGEFSRVSDLRVEDWQ